MQYLWYLYLRYWFKAKKIHPVETKYLFNGSGIDRLLIKDYLKNTKTDYSKYQNGLEKTLNFKVVLLDHIKRIKILKQEYTII